MFLLCLTGFGHAADDATPPKPSGEANPEADKELRKKALELNAVTGADPTAGRILALIEDAGASKRLLAAAARMAKEKDQPFNVNATYILARSAHLLKEVDAAQVFYRLNADQAIKMGSGQRLSQAYGGLIQLLYNNKKFAEAEKVCKEFLDLDSDDSVERLKPVVLRQMILALAKQDQFDKATDLLDKLIKAQPENWLNLELKGTVLREAGKSEESAKTYEEVIEKIKGDKRLKKEEQDDFVSDLQYRLSGVYIDLKQVDKAAEQLKALLEKEPDNPTYNNDLGYIWADHDMNLAESEKMIRKALEDDRKQRRKASPDLKPAQDKDNASYLDSLGWVLFKQKKFKEAKPILLKAVEDEEGRNIEIYDHLADVHMALGEKAEAVAAWKKGLEAVGASRREQQRKAEVEKKLKANP